MKTEILNSDNLPIDRLAAGSLIPFVVTETGADSEPPIEVLICDAIAGGRRYIHGMPADLHLLRRLADGSEFRAKYALVCVDPATAELPSPAIVGDPPAGFTDLRKDLTFTATAGGSDFSDSCACTPTESCKAHGDTFRRDLARAINRNSRENGSNTPDFILADFLARCLEAFDAATRRRADWNESPEPASEMSIKINRDAQWNDAIARNFQDTRLKDLGNFEVFGPNETAVLLRMLHDGKDLDDPNSYPEDFPEAFRDAIEPEPLPPANPPQDDYCDDCKIFMLVRHPIEGVGVFCNECANKRQPDPNRPHKFEPYYEAPTRSFLCLTCDRPQDDSIHTEPAGEFPAAKGE